MKLFRSATSLAERFCCSTDSMEDEVEGAGGVADEVDGVGGVADEGNWCTAPRFLNGHDVNKIIDNIRNQNFSKMPKSLSKN